MITEIIIRLSKWSNQKYQLLKKMKKTEQRMLQIIFNNQKKEINSNLK